VQAEDDRRALRRAIADEPAHRRVAAQSLGVIHVRAAREPTDASSVGSAIVASLYLE
jgi:hypothetical protein